MHKWWKSCHIFPTGDFLGQKWRGRIFEWMLSFSCLSYWFASHRNVMSVFQIQNSSNQQEIHSKCPCSLSVWAQWLNIHVVFVFRANCSHRGKCKCIWGTMNTDVRLSHKKTSSSNQYQLVLQPQGKFKESITFFKRHIFKPRVLCLN